MCLELALRDQQKCHNVDWLIVERVELDAFLRTAERDYEFGDRTRRGVRVGDEAEAGAQGGLALLYHCGNGVLMFRLDLAGGDEVFDEFVNRLPPGGGLQIRKDL